jgi:hypothetical protein
MGIRAVWKILVGLGVALLWFAFTMTTSVSGEFGSSRVHNLSLASQQQTLLLVGATLFLGGIILFAVVKLRQTREEEAKELDIRKAQGERIREATRTTVSKAAVQVEAAAAHVKATAVAIPVRTVLPVVLTATLFAAAVYVLVFGLMFFIWATEPNDSARLFLLGIFLGIAAVLYALGRALLRRERRR